MNELERLVRDTFVEHEKDAPDGARLLTHVRSGVARRRWTQLVVPFAAACSVAVVVAVVVQASGGPAADGGPLGAEPGSTSAQTVTPTSGPDVDLAPGGDPAALLGAWIVTSTQEDEAVTLTLDAVELKVSRPCGEQRGEWRASATGLFVASTSSWSPTCESGDIAPEWLTEAVLFELNDSTVRLLGSDGVQVAVLVPGHASASELGTLPTSAAPGGQSPPSAPVELPVTLEPVTPQELIGRWVVGQDEPAVSEELAVPFANFLPGGTWSGSDGCNYQGGRWVAGEGGELLATQGPQTLIGCEGVSVGGWLTSAVVAGMDDDTLVLLDGDGQELGRLQRG